MIANLRNAVVIGLAALGLAGVGPNAGQAQDPPILGEMRFFAGSYAPVGWAKCDGQLLNIADHEALFALLSCTYGGDCLTTFALPDMRGRMPVHPGQGHHLAFPRVDRGEQGGGHTSDPVNKRAFNDVPAVTLTCIISLDGVFPSRN